MYRRLMYAMVLLTFVLVVGSSCWFVMSMRAYLRADLTSRTQLAFSVVQNVWRSAPSSLQAPALTAALGDALIHAQSLQRFSIEDNQAHLLWEKKISRIPDGVPLWFIHFLQIPPVIKKYPLPTQAVGQAGVYQLVLEAGSGPAYKYLWQQAKNGLLFLLLWISFGIFLPLYFVRRISSSAQHVENQAVAVRAQPFQLLEVEPSSEFKQVSAAMRYLSGQLKQSFSDQVKLLEKVCHQLYQEEVTGLGNGLYFHTRLNALTPGTRYPAVGALLLLSIKDFNHYNVRYGRVAGDLFLKQIAGRWQKILAQVPSAALAKLTGAEFVAWLPNVTIDEAEQYLHNVFHSIVDSSLFAQQEKQKCLHVGMIHCEVNHVGEDLLAQARTALELAQSREINGVQVMSVQRVQHAQWADFSQSHWRKVIHQALNEKKLQKKFTPVVSLTDGRVLWHELSAYFLLEDKEVGEDILLPCIQRFDMQLEWDRWMVLTLLEHLAQQAVADESTMRLQEKYSLHISAHSLQSAGFVEWILEVLTDYPKVTEQLIIEIPEIALSLSEARVHTLATGLQWVGGRVCIDQVRVGLHHLSALSRLPLYAIKLDMSYVLALQQSKATFDWVQSIQRILASREVLLLMDRTQTQEQWNMLKQLQLDGACKKNTSVVTESVN